MNNKIIKDIINKVSDEFHNILKDSMLDLSLSKEEYDEKNKNKIELQMAIKECIFQNDNAKNKVKEEIANIIQNNFLLNEYNIEEIIQFSDASKIDSQIKFNILIYDYQKKYNKDALCELIKKYKLDILRKYNNEESYFIDDKDINDIYEKEKIKLNYEDKINIIVQYIYSKYKGFGAVDEILEMNIDGINGGVSGIESDGSVLNSIWIIYQGKNIHFKFLFFENEEEIKRICMNIYKYNSPGELSKSDGYKINKLKDGSRIVVMRPDFSENWVFFVRKFHASNMEMNEIVKGNNNEKVINLLKFITMGCNNICISGQQGSGKTTMLLNLIEYIYPVYPIRCQETSFELNIRKKFPYRNVVTIQETDEISGQKGLDLLKKTDGLINIIGEVASDDVACQLIQSGKVASKSTLFTHHAKSTRMLIKSLRNSLLKSGVFKNEKIAEEEVSSVINFDIHLEKDFYGKRYIEKINEIVFDDQTGEYLINELITYKDNSYVIGNLLSKTSIDKINKELKDDNKKEFEKFINSYNEN